MLKSIWKPLVSFILILNLASPALAKESSFQCYDNQKLSELNPEVAGVPLLYWRAKVGRELALFMVEVKDMAKPLFKLVECEKADLREEKPSSSVVDSTYCKSGKIKHLGNLWLPIAEYTNEDPEQENYVLEDPTQYFRYQIRENLQEYADSYRWDPYVQTLYNSFDKLLWAGVGTYILVNAWKKKPTTRRGKGGRWAGIFFGFSLMAKSGFEAVAGAESEFVSTINRESAELESLVQKMDEDLALRLDGQDRPANLEDTDGYSALINSIKKANIKTQEQFCN